MQEVITNIGHLHGIDFSQSEAHLRLEMKGYDRLVIENVGVSQVSVAHYYEENGDLVADPDIVFFIGATKEEKDEDSVKEWFPIEAQFAWPSHFARPVTLVPSGNALEQILDLDEQRNLGEFADEWADNIEAQGWLSYGIKWEYPR